MGIIAWIVLGGLAGWIASLIMKSGSSLITNIVLGIIGAFLGGFITAKVVGIDVTGINISSLLIAILGAIILIFLARLVKK